MSTTSAETESTKWAETDPEVLEIIRARWSPRAFNEKPISDRDLRLTLEAAQWASSSYNEQPWRFLIARKSDPHFPKFVDLLFPFNQLWAKNAQVLIVMAYKTTFSHNGSPNRFGLHDTGQALANLALQATALGFHAHGMGGFDSEKARQQLGIPEGFDVAAAVALGYSGSADILPDQFKGSESAPRTRKELAEIAFSGTWLEPIEL